MTEKVRIQDVSVDELQKDLLRDGFLHIHDKYEDWDYAKAQLLVLRETTRKIRQDLELMGYRPVLKISREFHEAYLVVSIELNSGSEIGVAFGWSKLKDSKLDTFFTHHIIKNLNAMIKAFAVKSNVYIPDSDTTLARVVDDNFALMDFITDIEDDPRGRAF